MGQEGADDGARPRTPVSTARRWRWLVLAFVVVVGAAVAMVALLADDAGETTSDARSTPAPSVEAPRGAQVVTELSGDGNRTTGRLEVQEGWEIRWETTGKSLELAVVHGEETDTVLRFSDGPGGGTTRPVRSGTVRLGIVADGAWSIVVVNHAEDT